MAEPWRGVGRTLLIVLGTAASGAFAGESVGLDVRRLKIITTQLDDSDGLHVHDGVSAGGTCYPDAVLPSCGILQPLYAGVQYSAVQIRAAGSTDTFNAPNARLRLVKDTMTWTNARNGACKDGDHVLDGRYVDNTWLVGATTTPDGNKLKSDSSLKFRMGGTYKICYSQDGSFGLNTGDLVRMSMQVNGVFDSSPSCPASNPKCLSHKRYECYLRKQAFSTENGIYQKVTSCVVDFAYAGAGVTGAVGLGSWSAEWTTSGYHEGTGALLGMVEQMCGTTPAAFICRDGGACDSGGPYIGLDKPYPAHTERARFNIPTITDKLKGETGPNAFKARSVHACYCPKGADCGTASNFVQEVGVLHFYLSKVCHADDKSCLNDFVGVTPQYRFRIRVECPTNACSADSHNRMKLVAKSAANDKPSWDSLSGCGLAQHGLLGGVQTLPQVYYTPIDGTAAGTVNPENCKNALECSLNGGNRQDYKDFGGHFGFRFIMGFTVHEQRAFHSTKDVDVCYCNSGCETQLNWFKVGSMKLSPTRLVSAATSRSNLPSQWNIEYMNQPGTVGLQRLYAEAGTLGLQENSLLKIVQDDGRVKRDDSCALDGYNSQYTFGLANPVQASLNYLGKRQTETPPDLQKIVFNSNAFVNTITVKSPGSLAVCYCAITVDTMCTVQANWKLVTHLTIKGPKFNQRWMFSTNVVFRFSYEGYGLTSGDSLRIISPDGQCTDNNFNPNTAAWPYTGMRVNCPVPCNDVGTVSDPIKGDLSTIVLSDDNYKCSRLNGDCANNDIEKVQVLSESETEVTFQQKHGLKVGQEITMGANIICKPGDPVCTPEMLTALKGVFDYGDRDYNNGQAPNEYILPHRILSIPDGIVGKKVRIPIGWPTARRPQFEIAFANANLMIGYIGRGGKWTLHSKGETREEILGSVERANLRVCWRYGGNGAKYVAEVGRLTIRNPAPMEGSTVSMSSSVRNNVAPMILTFRTADGVTGLRYDQAEDSLRLKILFDKAHLFDIVYSDAAGTPLPELADVDTENEQEKGTQQVCGKLFLEVWSNDMSNGFPLPKGCWYKTFTDPGPPVTLKSREVFLIFEAKSGLRKNTIYQMVFNGRVKEPLPGQQLPKKPLVKQDGEYMKLYPMDDVTARPYEAIESGSVKLTTDPQVPPFDPADPKFRIPDGFKLVGGHEKMLELKSGDAFVAEIMGSPQSGAITKQNIIRVFLWPLLQWQTTSSCTAKCLFQAEKSFLCGQIESCKGLAVVPGMSLNILKITLPEIWQPLYGDTKVQLEIGGITPPTGGFFAQRFAVQVSKEDDTRPHYIHSVGDYIWKQPNDGTTVSKVVGTIGGGNIKPFRGDTDNVLYVRMILSSTIMGRRDLGVDASFTVTLPTGYTCLDKNPTWVNGSNAWTVPSTLPAFGSKVPQGRGTPDAMGTTHGWSVSGNTCTYTPAHPNGILYAGSSFMFRVYVNNPSFALTRTEMSNFWTVSMSNYGTHPTQRQTTKEFVFLHTGDPNYQPNYAALGRITDAGCQPTTFTPSARRTVSQELRFFFRSEQQVGANGFVRLYAPEGFSFQLEPNQPCNATHLADLYYANPANPTDATLRLPGIVSCTTSGSDGTVATIGMEQILAAGRVFGLKIWVKNPTGWTDEHSSGWKIFTMDEAMNLVDGTPDTVPFTASQDGSWGLYTSGTMQAVALSVSNMLPYSMLSPPVPATVKLVIHSVPTGPSGKVRFVAPDGYLWHFTPQQFVYQTYARAPQAHKIHVPPAITADWPGGVPTGTGTRTITWNSAQYMVLETYGFACFVKVPNSVPTTSSNSFFLEFGFDSTTSSGRIAAMTLPAPRVRNLQMSDIDYTTNIKAKENVIQFRIQTVTHIPAGGGIEITAPFGFKFATPCELLQAFTPGSSAPPKSLACTRFEDKSAGPNGKPVLRLAASGQGLRPGVYYFGIIAENPAVTSLNYESNTQCGTYLCWVYKSFRNLEGAEPREELDLHTSARGFSIFEKMLEARIPVLTEAQRRGTNRDDRPKNPNNVIFAFKLFNDASTEGELTIRGPHGFIFEQTCLDDITVSEATVFGLGNRFPPSYTVWPQGVRITSCFGTGRIANLTVSYDAGAKLMANKLYLFRVGLKSNPLTTPFPNRWVIEINREASEPFEGMTLWAFTDTQITPIATARDRTLAGYSRTPNPLRISLRPHNDIPQGAYISIQAPFAFQFQHLPSLECDAQLREIPYMELGVSYPGHVWPATGLTCLVTPNTDSSRATIRLRDPRAMRANLLYLLIVFVYNPREIFEPGPTVWKVSSFTATSLSLDESLISSFSLNRVMNLWRYTNPDPADPTKEVRNGGTELEMFTLQMRFPDALATGDMIVIEAMATEFKLVDTLGKCRGLKWIGENPLPNSPTPQCSHSNVTIHIKEPGQGIARDTLIEFGLKIVNPLKTPNPADNFWRCKHLGPAPGRLLKSSKTFESWQIIPQLEDVEVQLLGPKYAAEALSTMRVAFTAVNDAEDVAIMASKPPRFVFNRARPEDKEMTVILAQAETIRIRMKIVAGVRYSIVLNDVQLGREGGQTDFKLTSWVGGMWQSGEWKPGIKRDEKLHYTAGFRLPGRTIMRYEKLENDYHKDPNTYPVQSRWEAQTGRPCYVEFNFLLTQRAETGSYLRLMAKPYEPTMRTFKLEKAPPPILAGMTSAVQTEPEKIGAEVTSVRLNEFRAKLLEPLVPYVVYKVILSAITPSAQSVRDWGAPITWSIDTLDGGLLPMNTNDGESQEFSICEEYTVDVTVSRAPPIAEVFVTLHINPHLSIPTEIRVVAPKGFNFTAYNCLVSGYPAITACKPGQPFADGRSVAVLTTSESGLRTKTEDLQIRVMTPRATPMNKAWYIEGIDVLKEKQLGWGEATGFDIKNMSDISVTYPGIPGELGMIVWRFRTEVMVSAGAWLEINTPPELGAECFPGRFEPITLPESSGCKTIEPGLIYVNLNSTIVPAEYAFAHYVIPPVDTPVRNVLSITLKDHDGTVKDAAVDLPGYRIWEKLKIRSRDLVWDISKPGRTSTITVGFTVVEPLPDNIVAPNQQVFTILITLPVGFIHLVQDVNDFQVLNENMPLVRPLTESVDYMAKDSLRVYMNPNGTAWNALKAGDYKFRFQVLVPELMPAYNVWQVSLCRPGYGPCNRVSAPAVLVNFAVKGFAFEEEYVEKVTVAPTIGMATAAAHSNHRVAWTTVLLIFTSLGLGCSGAR